ncbi:hypothetical protein [Streptomyces yaizuensis]|uniref:Secreted protein n=1 Tax=Streptomyces yaizuensis TaxID=2989713 RepID=A0ABQ5NUG1_9ACTN|nr:hypothetical protein [Streptomyces sp. YSPA8]GLF94003.1 hypothetical protein SYYSPA8_06920 [Streptomyces sp. YSPA8]
MGGSPSGHRPPNQRPTALLSAVATLLGALFLCLATTPDDHHGPGITLTPAAQSAPAFSCPYENGSCGLRPVLSAAVLTVPPPDSVPAAEEPAPRPDRSAAAGAAPATPVRSRAPDLHVLQVLRT